MKLKAMTLTKVAARSGWVCAAGIFLALAIPRPANAQFGLDLAAILAGLQKVFEPSDQQHSFASQEDSIG